MTKQNIAAAPMRCHSGCGHGKLVAMNREEQNGCPVCPNFQIMSAVTKTRSPDQNQITPFLSVMTWQKKTQSSSVIIANPTVPANIGVLSTPWPPRKKIRNTTRATTPRNISQNQPWAAFRIRVMLYAAMNAVNRLIPHGSNSDQKPLNVV